MANQITDQRTLVHAADVVTPYDNLAGTAAGTQDTDIKVQGTASNSWFITNSLAGLLFDNGSAADWSNNVFYIWVNCGIVGLLDTKANGGFRVRFCGNTVTDFFEFYVGGSDSWPTAVEGGWVQFVVDIEGTASNTGGTPPATNAIRYVGTAAVTGGTMPKMVDNCWMDEIRRLPDGTAGIRIEGRNGGSTDWTWPDLPTQLGVGVGTAKNGPGGSVLLNCPVEFGIDDGTTHAFNDTNTIVLWEDQEFAPTDLYKISLVGAATGTVNWTMGVKSGTGDDATGAQGGVIAAAAGGVRWDFDSDGANIDSCNMYGVQLVHGGDFQLDTSANSWISCTFLDCSSARVDNAADFLDCSIVDANTADGVAFITTDDITDIVRCNFAFSDGHAVELTTPIVSTQTSKGNRFTGYGADDTNDAAIYNNAAGAVTIDITDGGTTGEHTVRNGSGASTTVQASVTVNVTVINKDTQAAVEGAAVYVQLGAGPFNDNDQIVRELTNASGLASDTFAGATPASVTVRVRKIGFVPDNSTQTITGTGLDVTVSLRPDPNQE